jgi:hypothetical protein
VQPAQEQDWIWQQQQQQWESKVPAPVKLDIQGSPGGTMMGWLELSAGEV